MGLVEALDIMGLVEALDTKLSGLGGSTNPAQDYRRARRRAPTTVALGRRPGGRRPGGLRVEEQRKTQVTETASSFLAYEPRRL
jgi:hypothetical protein